jgi:hypothetical protein
MSWVSQPPGCDSANGSGRCLWPVVLLTAGATTHQKISSGCAASVLANESDALRGVMNSPRITYVQRPDATPEAELNVLANVYRFILECHGKKMAAEPAPEPDGRDGTKLQGDSADAQIISR